MRRLEFQVKDFHLDHIFDCGQCFRWNREEDGSYVGIAGGRIARMTFQPAEPDRMVRGQVRPCTEGVLVIEQVDGAGQECGIRAVDGVRLLDGVRQDSTNFDTHLDADRQFWTEYLDLERDYGRIKRSLARGDRQMARAVRCGEGIRLLKQDFWETMISFIISQNNHIPRIKGCIEAVAAAAGMPAGQLEGRTYFQLPSAQALAALSPAALDSCRLGYRAPYLIETARQVVNAGGPEAVEDRLRRLKETEGPDAVIRALQEFTGVGPKVAACIALFGVQNFRAFPLDVWMKRTMHETYGFGENDVKGMEEYARENFAGKEGFAQQYLFYAARTRAQEAARAADKNPARSQTLHKK